LNERNEQIESVSQRSGKDVKYLATVGVLLVVIIGLLALLWVQERRARMAAQHKAADWRQRYEQMQIVVEQIVLSDRPLPTQPTQEPTTNDYDPEESGGQGAP